MNIYFTILVTFLQPLFWKTITNRSHGLGSCDGPWDLCQQLVHTRRFSLLPCSSCRWAHKARIGYFLKIRLLINSELLIILFPRLSTPKLLFQERAVQSSAVQVCCGKYWNKLLFFAGGYFGLVGAGVSPTCTSTFQWFWSSMAISQKVDVILDKKNISQYFHKYSRVNPGQNLLPYSWGRRKQQRGHF